MGLQKDRGFFRIKPGSQVINHDFDSALLDAGSVGVITGQRVPVSDEEEALVLLLQFDPVGQRANVVAQMQFARGAHAAEDTRARIRLFVCHVFRTEKAGRHSQKDVITRRSCLRPAAAQSISPSPAWTECPPRWCTAQCLWWPPPWSPAIHAHARARRSSRWRDR